MWGNGMFDTDDTFDALADEQRRHLLLELLEQDPYSVQPLSNESRKMMTAHRALLRQYLSGSMEIDGADKAHIRMHSIHLPKLVDHGFVEWEQDANVVTKAPRFDEVKHLLELVDNHRDDHPEIESTPLRE